MVNTGSDVLDTMIKCYPKNNVTMIYGPGASGKTTCCFLALIEHVLAGNKVIYVDTENGFNVERFSQLAGDFSREILEKTFLLNVTSFYNQSAVIKNLEKLSSDDTISLIIIDTIGNHYRLELKRDSYLANRMMDEQLKVISNLKKTKTLLITNQVYQNIEKRNEITMVGGRMIKERADCLIELEKTHDNSRFAVLKNYPDNSCELNKKIRFEIREKGIYSV